METININKEVKKPRQKVLDPHKTRSTGNIHG